ncbi:MAG: winged helix-turn-helix transcriptional regulator [Ruminococcaceae bacterium]|nr:winged helix-turn-helix transcriptional regulator [Oscillospiraceae bacterium]
MTHGELPHNHGNKTLEVFEKLPQDKDFETVSDIFGQLGDKNRLKIFWILCHCEDCVINLSAMMEMSSPAISHHLKILKTSGLIVSRREGKEVYYKAAETEQTKMLHDAIETLMAIVCPMDN